MAQVNLTLDSEVLKGLFTAEAGHVHETVREHLFSSALVCREVIFHRRSPKNQKE